LKLKKGRDKSVRNRHPWIFSGAVEKAEDARSGDITAVTTAEGERLGFGFYDPHSQIVCRIFHFGVVHDDFESDRYWRIKIENAYVLRKKLILSELTNCYRLIHAEGDGFPGLIADVYAGAAVLQCLTPGTELRKGVFAKAFKELGFENIFIKNSTGGKAEGSWDAGRGEGLIEVRENGLRFLVDVEKGQKTGFFLDQRENRKLASEVSRGRRVLNLFSYTGGFSVAALSGGALEAVSVDVSEAALELCEKNVRLNFPEARHITVAEDCFQYLRNVETAYDMIVVDPPAFAKNRGAVNQAARGYKDLNMIAIKKAAPGGLIFTFSCSQHISADLFQKIVFGAAVDAGREAKILQRLQQPADHPVSIYHPEGEYLKGLLLRVE